MEDSTEKRPTSDESSPGAAHRSETCREAVGETQQLQDELVVYLSTVRSLVGMANGQASFDGLCQKVAAIVAEGLGVEQCAVLVRNEQGQVGCEGFCDKAQGSAGPASPVDGAVWFAVLRTVEAAGTMAVFERGPDGGWRLATGPPRGELLVGVPVVIGGECCGALVCHDVVGTLVTPGRDRAVELIGDIVGQILTVAQVRQAIGAVQDELEREIGLTRQALLAKEQTLRTQGRRVGQLTEALIRSNRAKSEFLGIVSHELRTPLNVIVGYATLLREKLTGPLTSEQEGQLDRILVNAHNLTHLIEDILFLVQLESGMVRVDPGTVVVPDLIEDVALALPRVGATAAVTPGPDFACEVAPDCTRIETDGALLRRVLFHLLSNAFKFTTQGEVRLSVRPADRPSRTRFSISDTGVGIPPEKVTKIFRLFEQGDASTTRRYHGVGLGLSLVRHCLGLLGGEIWVRSKPGVGSEFAFELPLLSPGARPSPAGIPVAARVHAG